MPSSTIWGAGTCQAAASGALVRATPSGALLLAKQHIIWRVRWRRRCSWWRYHTGRDEHGTPHGLWRRRRHPNSCPGVPLKAVPSLFQRYHLGCDALAEPQKMWHPCWYYCDFSSDCPTLTDMQNPHRMMQISHPHMCRRRWPIQTRYFVRRIVGTETSNGLFF